MACRFCEFLSGVRVSHEKGYPFLVLHETRRTISFLSQDIPRGKDCHVLVIPKRHLHGIAHIPSSILSELIAHVALASEVVEHRHGGCNILLNDGKSAGQVVPHVHFHVIPRDRHDRIRIEVWHKSKVSLARFLALHEELRQDFEKARRKRPSA